MVDLRVVTDEGMPVEKTEVPKDCQEFSKNVTDIIDVCAARVMEKVIDHANIIEKSALEIIEKTVIAELAAIQIQTTREFQSLMEPLIVGDQGDIKTTLTILEFLEMRGNDMLMVFKDQDGTKCLLLDNDVANEIKDQMHSEKVIYDSRFNKEDGGKSEDVSD